MKIIILLFTFFISSTSAQAQSFILGYMMGSSSSNQTYQQGGNSFIEVQSCRDSKKKFLVNVGTITSFHPDPDTENSTTIYYQGSRACIPHSYEKIKELIFKKEEKKN